MRDEQRAMAGASEHTSDVDGDLPRVPAPAAPSAAASGTSTRSPRLVLRASRSANADSMRSTTNHRHYSSNLK